MKKWDFIVNEEKEKIKKENKSDAPGTDNLIFEPPPHQIFQGFGLLFTILLISMLASCEWEKEQDVTLLCE